MRLHALGGFAAALTFALGAAATAPADASSPVRHVAKAKSPIAHVIVVSMENRTPDNLFCTAYPAFANPSAYGQPFPGMDLQCPPANNPAYETSLASALDPGHSYPELVSEWDNGLMDGFANDPAYNLAGQPVSVPGFSQTVVPPNETPIYSLLAATYVIGDRMFSSGLVPSFPGHQYMFAAQSTTSDDPDTSIWGCDAPPSSLVSTFGPNNTPGPGIFPCLDYNSLADIMDAKKLNWKYYTDRVYTTGGNIDAVGAINHLRYGPDFVKHVRYPEESVETDISNCKLAPVSFVNAPAFASDHSGTLSAGGPGFVGDLYLVLAETVLQQNSKCKYYDDTVMVVTWDDSGGWSDHVAPPTDPQTGRPYGMRVPIMVLSPFANHPTGYPVYVAHDTFTFGSIVRYIEDNFGLGTLGQQDAEATDLNSGDAGALINYDQSPIPPLTGIDRTRFGDELRKAKARVHTPPGTPVDDDK